MNDRKCVICGKPLKSCAGTGRARTNGKYCSAECRRKGIRQYSNKYYAERSKDKEWLRERGKASAERIRERKKMARELFYMQSAITLSRMTDEEEIKAYLEENFKASL